MAIEITKDEFFTGLRYVISSVILPAFWYLIKKINSIDAKMNAQDVRIAEISTTLIGVDGKNGVRGTVTDLKVRFEDYIMGLLRSGVPIPIREQRREDKDA